jgi:ribosome-binding protein aMBF1 (putative translation factor)
MLWTVETLNHLVDAEIEALPPLLNARLIRLMEMMENIGLERMREPHVKHIEQYLGVAREGRGRDRPRVLCHHKRPSHLHPPCLCQEVRQDATGRAGNRPQQNEGSEAMTKLATLKKRLMKNPKFRTEYEKADAEFSIVEALIKARTVAKLSQAEVAKRIGTTQSAIARLEAGNTEPTIPTLRRYAEATGKKLQIKLAG